MERRETNLSVSVIVPLLAAAAFGALWIDSYSAPRRFIFLPGGDVGLGFKSSDGILHWIEYAPWDPKNLDYPWWSVSYRLLVLACVIVAVSAQVFRRFRQSRSVRAG